MDGCVLLDGLGRLILWILPENTQIFLEYARIHSNMGNGSICIPIFVVLPKHSQFVDYSMIVRNYVFYSLNKFKYDFKRKFQYSIQNTKEHEILNTFCNPFHSFTSQKGTVFNWYLN
jgi:hypothetical protein